MVVSHVSDAAMRLASGPARAGRRIGPRDGVEMVSRAELTRFPGWASAFADCRKDHRYYELVEDTLDQGLEHGYFVVGAGASRVVQPFIVLDQDMLVGAGAAANRVIGAVRRIWPRCLVLRTLMVGCAAGEGRLDGDPSTHAANAALLAAAILERARELRAGLVVLKEFRAEHRRTLDAFVARGFARIPSMPMTRLSLEYASFDDYMAKALNSSTRRKLRKKFAAAASAAPIEMTEMADITPVIDEVYPLYLDVYERSKLHFEKLTPAYFCEISRRMPDKTTFFVWRQDGRIVAFAHCMFEGDAFYPEYVGFDYGVALKLHLYHYIVRDMITWAMAQGFKELRSSGLNYDPKLHLRHRLDPIDLYVRHRSPLLNAVLKRVLPWIEPTRHDPVLKKFANYADLWDRG